MTKKTDLESLFLRDKPVKILMSLKNTEEVYVSMLSKDADCTYSHTVKLLEQFKDMGLVEFKKEGRVKFVSLTKDGKNLADEFESVLRIFSKV